MNTLCNFLIQYSLCVVFILFVSRIREIDAQCSTGYVGFNNYTNCGTQFVNTTQFQYLGVAQTCAQLKNFTFFLFINGNGTTQITMGLYNGSSTQPDTLLDSVDFNAPFKYGTWNVLPATTTVLSKEYNITYF